MAFRYHQAAANPTASAEEAAMTPIFNQLAGRFPGGGIAVELDDSKVVSKD